MCAARGRFLHELEKCQKDCLGPPKGSEDAAWLRTSLLPGGGGSTKTLAQTEPAESGGGHDKA